MDACFSAAEVALITGLLAALCTTITVLYRSLLVSKDRELAATQGQTEAYRALARRALLSLERAWREQRAAAGLPPVALPVPDPDLAPEDLGARMDAVAAALAHGGPDG